MTINIDSQNFESYVPTYDAVPEKWEDARPFLVEQFKKISDGVNIREIGWFLDEELLSGKTFYPSIDELADGGTSQQFRPILRKVIIFPTITAAGNPNMMAHGIQVDFNFTLIQLWASATNSTTFRSVTFSNPDTIWMDATYIYIDSDNTYDRVNAFCEFIQEV